MTKQEQFKSRLARHYDELKWLYCELYEGGEAEFQRLRDMLEDQFAKRPAALKKLDEKRLEQPDWYRKNDIVGMMMYTDAFAKTLKGIREKLDYIEDCGVNCIHLMPLLDSPDRDNDGGYAVSDFTKVRKDLGTMEDLDLLEQLGETMQDSSLCALGKSAPNPVLTTLKYFREEYEAHIREHRCGAGVCKALTSFAIDPAA